MSATRPRSRRRRRGSTLVVVSFATVVVAGLSFVMLEGSTTVYRGTRARVEATKSFYVMEGGLDWTVSQLANDPYFALHDTVRFPTANADGSFETAWIPLGVGAGEFRAKVTYANVNSVPPSWTSPGLPPGFQPFAPLAIADRTLTPSFERFVVSVRGRYNSTERACRAVLKTEFKAYAAAMVSDGAPVDAKGDGTALSLAREAKAIVFAGENQYVYGGVAGNGRAYRDQTELTAENVATAMPNLHGPLLANAYGSGGELPDYTEPGGAQQLFDFDVFRSAAQAGHGVYFPSLTEFAAAMNTANAAGRPLEGVVFVTVDANVAGASARISAGAVTAEPTLAMVGSQLTTSGGTTYTSTSPTTTSTSSGGLLGGLTGSLLGGGSTSGTTTQTTTTTPTLAGTTATPTSTGVVIPGGIHVNGTLAFHVTNAPDSRYRLSIDTPLFVNAAALPEQFDPADPATFAKGYPSVLDASRDPRSYGGFDAGDDMPALIVDNGTLEILREANVCGVVFVPAMLRIENTHDERQFFDGAIIAGAGIYAEGGSANAGSQTIVFDPYALDNIATFDRLGKAPVFAGYVIDE